MKLSVVNTLTGTFSKNTCIEIFTHLTKRIGDILFLIFYTLCLTIQVFIDT